MLITEKDLRDALTIRFNRRIRGDGTVFVAGVDWEISKGFLAGSKVVMARALLCPSEAPWVEYDGKRALYSFGVSRVLQGVDDNGALAQRARTRYPLHQDETVPTGRTITPRRVAGRASPRGRGLPSSSEGEG